MLVAEARVLSDGVQSAIQVDLNQIVVEGDNHIVIQALKRNYQPPLLSTTI